MAFTSPNLFAGERTIAVTRAERDWLYNERIRAMNECGSIPFQIARKSQKCLESWLCALRIFRRDRDGSLVAAVVLEPKGGGQGYMRKLRVPASLGSRSSKDIHLRQRFKRG